MTRRLILLGLFVGLLPAPAQDAAKKKAQLRWHGQSFFVLETSAGKKVAFDPHSMPQYGRAVVSADVVCCTHEHDDHNQAEVVENVPKANVLRGVTVKGRTTTFTTIDKSFDDLKVKVRTVPTFHDEEGGLKRGKNAVFVVEADGLKFVHLGDLGHVLEPEQVKAIGPVDVLMVPIGGIFTINGEKALKVVEQLKPRLFVVPMHYGTKVFDELADAKEFCEGFKSAQVRDLSAATNVLEFDPALKADAPSVVLMGWQK